MIGLFRMHHRFLRGFALSFLQWLGLAIGGSRLDCVQGWEATLLDSLYPKRGVLNEFFDISVFVEGIVDSAAEADMALLYGLGFPPFRGGIFRWIETIGLANFVAMADKYAELGPIYQISDGVREMAASGKSYFA